MYDDWDHELLCKEVDYVKSEPFTYKIKVDPTGKKVDITVRIKVLTSQLEDMLFRVGVGMVGDHQKTKEVEYQYFSHPIRVISKVKKQATSAAPPKKISKRKAPQSSTLAPQYDDDEEHLLDSPPSEAEASGDTWEDLLALESTHEHQTSLLQALQSKLLENERLSQLGMQRRRSLPLAESALSSPQPPLEGSSSPQFSSRSQSKQQSRKKEPAVEFQKSFKFLMNAYTKIPENQKPPRVQSLVKQHHQTPSLQEMMDMLKDQTQQRDQFSTATLFQTEDPIFRQPQKKFHIESIPLSRSEEDLSLGLTSFSTSLSSTTLPVSSSSSSIVPSQSLTTECCHKRELNRIEAFYESVFTNGF